MTGSSSPRLRGEAGTTLAELTVTMLVFGLLATFLATTVVQTTRLARTSAVREDAAQRASLLIAQVTRDLRTAVRVGENATVQSAFTAAGPSSVSFFASGAPHVLRERLFFATSATGPSCTPTTAASSCVLWRETQRPDDGRVHPDLRYTDPARIAVARVVPADLPHTVTFSYRLKGSTTEVPSVTSAPDLQSIIAVSVRVQVDGDGAGRVEPVVLESTVRPYNG